MKQGNVPGFLLALFILPVLVSALVMNCQATGEAMDEASLNCHEMTDLWFGNTEELVSLFGSQESPLPLVAVEEYFSLREWDVSGVESVKLFSADSCSMCAQVSDENIARKALLRAMEKRANIDITDADVTWLVDEDHVEHGENGTIILYVYEWTFFDYDDLTNGVGGSDVSGFGTPHKITLAMTGDSWQICADEYDERVLLSHCTREIIDTAREAVDDTPAPLMENSGSVSLLDYVFYSSYNVSAVIQYADKYVKPNVNGSTVYEEYYNPAYRNYNDVGGDCANYVSQCISAGGMPQVYGTNGWYYNSGTDSSSSWRVAPTLRNWMANNRGKLRTDVSDTTVFPGSPVFTNYGGHSTICVGYNSAGRPILNSHNGDCYHTLWSLFTGIHSTVQLTPSATICDHEFDDYGVCEKCQMVYNWQAYISTAIDPFKAGVYKAVDAGPVRSEPYRVATELTELTTNRSYDVVEMTRNAHGNIWFHVRSGGIDGWVYYEHLTFLKDFPPPPVTVTMTTTDDAFYKSKEFVTETNACVVTKITKTSGSSITRSGVTLFDATGNIIKDYWHSVTNVSTSTTTFHSWYEFNSEVGVMLKPGTTYQYQFHVTVNGSDYYSNVYAFTTIAVDLPCNTWILADRYDVYTGELVTLTFGSDNATQYALGIDKDGVRIATPGTSDTSYQTSFDTPGTYSIYVTGSNIAGYDDSGRIWITVRALPSAPSMPSVTTDCSTVRVYWNDVERETGYTVYLIQSPWNWADVKYSQIVAPNTTSATFYDVADGDYAVFLVSMPNDSSVQSPWASFQVRSTYLVHFDANGGTGAPEDQTGPSNVDLVIPDVEPMRVGYRFVGWADSATATSAQYLPSSSFPFSGNVTVYAVWLKNKTYTISFDANGGTGAPTAQTKEELVFLKLSNTYPLRENYVFLGWATSADATEAQYQPGDWFYYDEDTILYAIWRRSQYQVIYYKNDGTDAVYLVNTTNYGVVTLIDDQPFRSGYNFLGWATDPDATGASLHPGDTLRPEKAEIALYAVWTPKYSLTAEINSFGLVAYTAEFPRETSTYLIIAGYETSGRMINVSMTLVTAGSGMLPPPCDAPVYRVLLVHSTTFTPLCNALTME